MRDSLVRLLEEYEAFHTHPTNRLTHKVAIPLIVFTIVAMLDWVELGSLQVAGHDLTLAFVLLFPAICWYFWMAPFLAPLVVVPALLCIPLGRVTPPWLVIAIAIFAWLVQLAGHAIWEKRSPAFFTNLVQLLVGPLFLVALFTGGFSLRGSAGSRPTGASMRPRDLRGDREQGGAERSLRADGSPATRYMSLRSAVVVFFLGGFALLLCDRVHIAWGVLEQADRSVFGQAFWVFPLFGLVSITTVTAYGRLRGAMGEPARSPGVARTAVAAVWALGAYAATGPLDGWGAILLGVLALAWIVRIAFEKDRVAVVFCLALAVVGPLGEAALSATGAFHYLHPDMGSVPSWLPGIYLHGGLLVVEVEAWLAQEGD